MKKFTINLLILFFLLINFKTVKSEILIKAKVNNQIITNFDIKNEKNYLLALNPNLRNLPDENIYRYAINSAINEKVKEIEIEKKYEILQNDNIIKKVISDLYLGIGISNINEFKKYLKDYNVNLDTVKKKIAIEVAWNDYIVQKYNNAILIDEDKIKNKISKLSAEKTVDNMLLSEIIFTINEKKVLRKLEIIRESINK